MKNHSDATFFKQLSEEEKHDLQTIIMFALRYSMGRKTYAFGLVAGFINSHPYMLQEWQLKQMAEEINHDLEFLNLPEWEVKNYKYAAKVMADLAKNKMEV